MELFNPNSNIDFMRWRKVTLSLALLAFVASLAIIGLKGFNYALEFTGGTMVRTHFAQPIHVEDVRDRLSKAGIHNAQVQSVGGGNDVMIRLQPDAEHNNAADAAQKVSAQVLAAVNTTANPATVQPGEFVGPQVGRDLAMNGVYATLFMLVGFLIYIAARFEWKFAMVPSSPRSSI